ncbi:MAG: GNAT family N-acetyltransferase [Lachnospiraceae bacterium]|nr:GNAT family N-acetyltransferase [Lachnospiraceae bacterium]
MITLREITGDNLEEILALRVAEGQRAYVSSNAESLAQAYVYRETAFPFGVYDGERPVGFIMMGYYEAKDYYTLWKFMIDEAEQGKGYGRQALELGIRFLQEKFGIIEVYTGVIPGNAVAKGLYESFGFAETGLFENGMLEMRLRIS